MGHNWDITKFNLQCTKISIMIFKILLQYEQRLNFIFQFFYNALSFHLIFYQRYKSKYQKNYDTFAFNYINLRFVKLFFLITQLLRIFHFF
jgi:hypothetical protein